MNVKRVVASLLVMVLLCGCTPKETDPVTEESGTSDTSSSVTDSSEQPSSESTSETVAVNDTTPPMILSANSSVKLNVGDLFDPNEYISYIDDYDRNPVLSLETPVDTTVAGKYETKIIITDSSGNSVSKKLTVKVIGDGYDGKTTPTPTPEGFVPSPTPTPAPKHLDFADFVNRYKGDGVEFGIDVSKWQGDVDYEQVKAAGCTFVIIRAGVYYKGEFSFDSKFEQNLQNAKAAGLKVGLYFFTPITSEEVLRENVDKICNALNGVELELPIAYDMETWGKMQQYNINLNDLNGLFYAFCEQVESHGYKAMMYNSKNKLETVWDSKGYPVWLAHYTKQTSYEGDYFMWQVNNTGRIPGIKGDVDLNLLYPDRYKE